MATSLTTLNAYLNTAAKMSAYIQEVTTRLAALGLVQTADTGQVDPATVAATTGAEQIKGYQVWRFSDAHQATMPVFIKIWYGSGVSYPQAPGLWIQVGTGTDGVGNLTGQVGAFIRVGTQNYVDVAAKCIFSGEAGRISFVLFFSAASCGIAVNVERSRDASGNLTDEGVIVQTFGAYDKGFSQFIPKTGTIRAAASSLPAALPGGATTMAGGADVILAPLWPWGFDGQKQPGTGFLVYFGPDLTNDNPVPVSIYGANHTYYPINQGGLTGVVSGFATSTLAMRYE